MTTQPLSQLIATQAWSGEDDTLYAQAPWTSHSLAIAAKEDSPEAEAALARGLSYLLEVDIAQEVLETWTAWRNGADPTPDQACAAIIHYATHDAYQPVEDQPL
jgi:hypothetical protein